MPIFPHHPFVISRDLTYIVLWTVLFSLILFIEAFEIRYSTLSYHILLLVLIWVVGVGCIYYAQIHIHQKTQEKNKAVQNYQESETRYQSIIVALAEGIVMHDATGKIITSNKSAENILGLTQDQLHGRTSIDPRWRTIHEDGTPFLGEEHPAMITLKTGKPLQNIIMGVHKPNGNLSWISINSQPIFQKNAKQPSAVVASFTDITIRKSAETELAHQRVRAAQADRLQVLGEMSAGMAHELNQPLGAISATAEGTLLRYENQIPISQEKVVQAMQYILDMVERMSDTINHLRIFSRDTSKQNQVHCSLNEVIHNSLKMIHTQLINHDIELILELDETLPSFYGHPQELEHIFINLLTNARDALDEKDEKLKDTQTWQKQIILRSQYNANTKKIIIEIEDNGIGISSDAGHRIFDPFFTTKPEDIGTGLGLSISYGIIKRHAGTISFESNAQCGTKFKIEFPKSQQSIEEGEDGQTSENGCVAHR